MNVYPAGRGWGVYRNIEICDDELLERLYGFSWKPLILLMAICMDNRMYCEEMYQSDPEVD